MDRSQVIAATLTELHTKDYRNGFNDSVVSHCCDTLDEFDGSGREFWSIMCCGYKPKAFASFFDSDQDLVDYYNTICALASGEGCFEMPSWGTRGT